MRILPSGSWMGLHAGSQEQCRQLEDWSSDPIDATTVTFFRESLKKAEVIEELFWDVWVIPPLPESSSLWRSNDRHNSGPSSQATQYPWREQGNHGRDDKGTGWLERKPKSNAKERLGHPWVKKNGINYYGYKNSICIDVDMVLFAVMPCPRQYNDSHIVPDLLDPENVNNYFWTDSTYSGECFESLLSLGGFEGLSHEWEHAINLLVTRPKSKIASNQQSEHLLSIFLAVWPCQCMES